MKKRYADGVVPEDVVSARTNIASQLRAARNKVNLTQQNLAELCGTKKSNISRMESGRYNPSLDMLVKVAGSLGLSVSIEVK
ncbi:MAG: helix-turn-helix transcriptional regulator [Lachnospiraceae bacterium]|nr:helix-turn-helix transcriptional regulator [Lachnospiraceae bacterium]